jgi:4-hydroxybenzoate polyprenyltransferase
LGTRHPHRLTRARPRWRAYLLLSRVSNLPTVWTNVLAGVVLSRGALELPALVGLMAAVSLLYVAGMFLNDAFDHAIDARVRPERPIPSGDVSPAAAYGIGAGLLLAGLVGLWWAGSVRTLVWGAVLGVAIVYYDYRHKQSAFGPIVMGICRGLVYCVAAAATGGVAAAVLGGAAVIAAYVVALTAVAKRLGESRRSLVPLLIAGISLVDAALIALVAPALGAWAALGFLLTLAGQRFVPGD